MSRIMHLGAQILPGIEDPKATVSAWSVCQCISADHRTKFPLLAQRAETYIVEAT